MIEHRSDGGDAAQAFEDLRAEVSVLRRAVEALPGAWEDMQPPDYTSSLSGIVKELSGVAHRLEVLERQPALKQTPDNYAGAIVRAGESAMQKGVKALSEATSRVSDERRYLEALFGTIRGQREQTKELFLVGIVCALMGFVLFPFVGMVLPFGWDGRVAAFILGESRWEAGSTLMHADNPGGWHALAAASRLFVANEEVLGQCSKTAEKTKKPQRCSIIVPAPSYP